MFWLDSDKAHLLQETRKRQMRRASRGSRPVVLVALEAVSVVVPVDSVSVVVAVEVVSCKHI